MRAIKFRAWDTYEPDKPEMIYIDPSDKEDGTCALDIIRDRDNWKVMQFTGLTDRNGKDIYEGDLVSIYFRNNTMPVTDEVCFDNGSYVTKGGRYLFACASMCTVVGNIYEGIKEAVE
jgi:uncharacterized phage protein (TIGR01671 family)